MNDRWLTLAKCDKSTDKYRPNGEKKNIYNGACASQIKSNPIRSDLIRSIPFHWPKTCFKRGLTAIITIFLCCCCVKWNVFYNKCILLSYAQVFIYIVKMDVINERIYNYIIEENTPKIMHNHSEMIKFVPCKFLNESKTVHREKKIQTWWMFLDLCSPFTTHFIS